MREMDGQFCRMATRSPVGAIERRDALQAISTQTLYFRACRTHARPSGLIATMCAATWPQALARDGGRFFVAVSRRRFDFWFREPLKLAMANCDPISGLYGLRRIFGLPVQRISRTVTTVEYHANHARGRVCFRLFDVQNARGSPFIDCT
ncbi:hypothetical protein BD309DRAFT_703865 [Dichomitus squalens]|nr:hypothetical protein BD309DRAFT_703865 [Dichomitus squalens]